MEPIVAAVLAIGAGVAGTVGGYAWARGVSKKVELEIDQERLKIEALRTEAEKEALEIVRQAENKAKTEESERREKLDRELGKKKSEIDRTEHRLKKREEQLDRRDEQILKREEVIEAKDAKVESTLKQAETRLQEIDRTRAELATKCEEISGLSRDEAKAILLQEVEKDVRNEMGALIRRLEQEAKETADRKARQLISLAIQKCASDHVSETTVSVFHLPSEEMKGRIIGREGRNIRALEQATGVNIIVDDTPEAVVLSCFDPMRREIARRVLEKLISDGRIHPSRIEEMVEKTEKQVLEEAREAGEAACLELQVFDIHPELVKLMGRLKYRTSYGQNILQHSIECGRIAEVLASELGLDAKLVKRATFLHDIGKAVSYEVEGPHAQIGANLAKKHRERPEVVHAIEAHHFEVEPRTMTAMLVIAADSISASRPGARRESLESYIKRLEQLETICKGFEGVEKAFAVQAGREVRIIVQPEKLDDNNCALLAREVTKKIENEMQYPGQIKVTVLRETRNVEFAR
ncbi:ribonuclease Y [bacterium]|nr:ribonuclease Y [bacterium]